MVLDGSYMKSTCIPIKAGNVVDTEFNSRFM